MGNFLRSLIAEIATSVALAALVSTSGAQADTPMCNEVKADPTIPTCACICEGVSGSTSSSKFAGCAGLEGAAQAPTPGQCPDMLQGRRVLSGGDALLVPDPTKAGAPTTTDMVGRLMLYQTEQLASNPGLGMVDGAPVFSAATTLPCRPGNGTDIAFPMQSRFARLFDLPNDMMVTLQPSDDSSLIDTDCIPMDMNAPNMNLITTSSVQGAAAVPTLAFVTRPEWIQLAIADFNYDGFDDMVLINIDSLQVFTANDTSDPTQGLVRMSSVLTASTAGVYKAPINEPVTGDFNGDGLLDVAWIGGDFPNGEGTLSVFFATVCPGSVSGTICDGAAKFQVILDPASRLFAGATSTIVLDNASLAPNGCSVVQSGNATEYLATGSLRAGAIAMGNFEDNGENPRAAPVDELVVAYVKGDGETTDSCDVFVQYWTYYQPDASQSLWATSHGAPQSLLIGSSPDDNSRPATYAVFAQASHLDWYGTTEQAVIGSVVSRGNYINDNEAGGLSEWTPTVVSISGSGTTANVVACNAVRAFDTDAFPYAWGIAAGRFSTYTTVNQNNKSACGDFGVAAPGDCPYNPQIAMLLAHDSENNTGNFPPRVWLYSVQASQPDGTDATLQCANDHSLQGFLPVKYGGYDLASSGADAFHAMPPATLRAGSQLRAGDAFGNSVRLGNPTITRVSDHTEPQLIIQAPPSHIDYVQPNTQDSGTPAIVNFTRAPANYQTQIQFTTGSEQTASTSETRSITSSTAETISGEVKFGVPLVGTVDVNDKQSWTQFHESNHSQKLSTYSSTLLKTGGEIGDDDQVWWTQTTFNVFNFPQLGVTNCPASITCDPSNPGCTGTASGAVLAYCEPAGAGCHCQTSPNIPSSLCPAMPSDATDLECNTEGGVACCSLLQQPLNVSFSGPQEETRDTSPGAAIEWYQPRHEPGQIFSYPANTLLLKARKPGSQELASLTSYTLGSNDINQTIGWTCITQNDVSTGTTTRHSFESDSSITAGTNGLADKDEGASVSVDFDYQHSDAFSTLNSYTMGLTASSSVGLLLEGAGFLNTAQYAYNVEGVVLGATRPDSVLDNPDPIMVCPADNPECTTAEQVPADCPTTGPITVAYAADPTTTVGRWWGSAAPYLSNIDVALNNPSRWRSRVPEDQVFNTDLQCRGPSGETICYASNQPPVLPNINPSVPKPSFATVWDTLFYDMKGLFVTLGGTSGPLRNTATVGDQIFLRARVYNYSLKTMDEGTKVYARFYRQQLDTSGDMPAYAKDADGSDLAAVPIGPTGLGDSNPVLVIGPDGHSNTIPPFNNSTDPSSDNIGLATTSYTAAADDDCEPGQQQPCKGAYYAYWVTVWAEDGDGNLIAELPNHGLNGPNGQLGNIAFDPDTDYAFITDVPLEFRLLTSNTSLPEEDESFTNNVGMFKMVFSIVPKATSGTLTATRPRPGPLSLDQVAISRDKTVLGEPVVVSAQVVEGGASAPGATVVFSDGDPKNGGKVFDAEWLPTIRALDRHFVRVNYNPESCGTHAIYAVVTGGSNAGPAEEIAMLDVGIDYQSAIRYLIKEVRGLDLDFPGNAGSAHKENLVRELDRAEQALDANRTEKGIHRLEQFTDALTRLELNGRIDKEQVDHLIAQIQRIIGCVG